MTWIKSSLAFVIAVNVVAGFIFVWKLPTARYDPQDRFAAASAEVERLPALTSEQQFRREAIAQKIRMAQQISEIVVRSYTKLEVGFLLFGFANLAVYVVLFFSLVFTQRRESCEPGVPKGVSPHY